MWKSRIDNTARNTLLAILLLVGPMAFGQRPNARRQTLASTTNAPAFDQDTTLRRVDFSAAMLAPPAPGQPGAQSLPVFGRKYTALYTRQGDLQQIVAMQGALFSSATVRYYFVQNEVVYIENIYVNASRMGSCGQINFRNCYFLNQQRLVSVQINQQPNTGFYASCYPVVPATELAQLLQALTPMLESLKAFRPPKP